MRGRRSYLRFVFWAKLVRERDGIVKGVYEHGRQRVDEGVRGGWCEETKRVLQEVGLGWVWTNEEVGDVKEWKVLVKKMVGEEEQKQWRRRMVGRKVGQAKVKLLRYMMMKTELKKEWFLELDRSWVRRWVRMRAGVESLKVELVRHRGVWRRGRVCRWCESGEVEHVGHVLDVCGKWDKERREMWEGIRKEDEKGVRRMWGSRGRKGCSGC